MAQLVEVNYDLQAQCEQSTWSNTSTDTVIEDSFCTAVWDSAYCWPPTPPGILIQRSCSEIFQEFYSQYSAYLEGNATRECLQNGTWSQGKSSNYSQCVNSFQEYLNGIEEVGVVVPIVHYMIFYGSILSLVCLGISLAIFHHFRCLQCDRVAVRLQLMYSLILRFLLMFIIVEPFVIGHSGSYRDVEILCKFVMAMFLYSTFSSVSWMFVQGIFLNVTLMTGVATAFTRYQFKIYHVIGWGVPASFVGAYVIVMAVKNQESCWKGYSDMDEMWILLGPISFELLINGLFLTNILRILLKRIRNSNSRRDESQLKAAVKAIFMLFPVLGISNLLLLYNPGGSYNKYFVLLNSFFGATQGIFVSIVFCFADKEVWAAIGRANARRNARRMEASSRAQNSISLALTPAMDIFSRRGNTRDNDVNMEHAV